MMDFRMSLIWLVLNRSSVVPLPRTDPACSKYPTPDEKSMTRLTGTSLVGGAFVCESRTRVGIVIARMKTARRVAMGDSRCGKVRVPWETPAASRHAHHAV